MAWNTDSTGISQHILPFRIQAAWFHAQERVVRRPAILSCLQDDRYGRTREELLQEDYLEGAEGGGAGQSPHGFWVRATPRAESTSLAFLLHRPATRQMLILSKLDPSVEARQQLGGVHRRWRLRAVAAVQGQIHAVMSHKLSKKEVALIKDSNIPIMVIHGRHDILALPRYGEKLARRCAAVLRPEAERVRSAGKV